MFEWLAQHYLRLIANFKILLTNPTHCSTVDLLQLFTLTLSGLFAIKLLLHLMIFQQLKRKYSEYTVEGHPHLFESYRRAKEKSHVRRLPPLFQFTNAQPLIFTIGSLRPAIFLAPVMVDKLPEKELEAAFVHELTHIKRFDNLLIWLLEIFFVALPLLIVQLFAIDFIFSIENSVYALLGTLAGLIGFKLFVWKRIIFLRELSCDDASVESIREPLILASSLLNVWRIAKQMPKYRWQIGLSFTQTFLPGALNMEYRISRLMNYKRPWLKFALGKAARVTAVALLVFITIFLWQFHNSSSQATAMYVQGGGFRFGAFDDSSVQASKSPARLTDLENRERCIMVMRKFAVCINAANFSGLSGFVDEELKRIFSLKEVRQNHKIMTDYFGKVVRVDQPRFISGNKAIFTTHFERAALDIQIDLNEEGKIIGIGFLPTFSDLGLITER